MKKLLLSTVLAAVAISGLSAAEVDSRRHEQYSRINQGVYSGSLTRGEAARLRGEERRLGHEIARDRFHNGGHLTRSEYNRVNRQENRISSQIYRYKHNGNFR
jgi:hypothetical protein